jgi:hypothetical protein
MLGTWTTQRVLELAPDSASANAGRGQAQASKWPLLGRAEATVWGEVQGSGKKPYQVRIDLREPAFKCSCPSRKFPCKHAIGLLLLFADSPDLISQGEPPDWVGDWLASRDDRIEKQKAKAEADRDKPIDAEAQANRAAKREQKVVAGVEQLKVLLSDLARQGTAAAQTQPYQFWDNAAARLVDAQAPGLARLVHELGETVSSGAGWQARFVRRLGRLHLAATGYSHIADLPDATRADLRTVVGWTTTRQELASLPTETGLWCVAGQVTSQEERLTVQRTWLVRQSDGRPAMVLDFAAGGQPLESLLSVGTAFPAELTYYPSAAPLRVAITSREEGVGLLAWPGAETIATALDEYSTVLAANPWLERWPLTLMGVRLAPGAFEQDPWRLVDSAGDQLALDGVSGVYWPLLSVSGGGPITVFGEWDGERLRLLGAWAGGGYYVLATGALVTSNQAAPIARVA